MKTPFVSLLLLLGLVGAAAAEPPADGDPALLASLGLERTADGLYYTHSVGGELVRAAMSDEQSARIAVFLEQLHAAPGSVDVVLARVALRRLGQARLVPDAVAPDGTRWFSSSFGRYDMTAEGRRAIPGIVVGSGSVENARALGAAPGYVPAARLQDVASRVDQILSGSQAPNFDGAPAVVAVVTGGEDASAPCPVQPQPARDSVPPPPPLPQHTALEDKIFWKSWWLYQLTWGADFATTAGILYNPTGQESDPLYTRFGSRSKAGVLGSVAVVHGAVSLATWLVYDRAKNAPGFWRTLLDVASIGTNLAGSAAHTEGTINNAIWLSGDHQPAKK